MSSCKYCGEYIEFRYINGRSTPVHPSGNWCNQDADNGSNYTDDPFRYGYFGNSYENVCRKTYCPECRDEVFFIKHNGGSIWVDSLGWPWPKHSCMHNDEEEIPSWYRFFKNNIKSEKDEINHAVVTDVTRINSTVNYPARMMLNIDLGNKKGVIFTEANTTTKYLLGQYIIINNTKKVILFSSHDVKPLFNMDKLIKL